MYDFQKLNVYTRARTYTNELLVTIKTQDLEAHTTHQLTNAAFKILTDVARGTAPFGPIEKSKCFSTARGSVHACAAILNYALHTQEINQGAYDQLIEPLDSLSRMLFVLAKKTMEFPERKASAVEKAVTIEA